MYINVPVYIISVSWRMQIKTIELKLTAKILSNIQYNIRHLRSKYDIDENRLYVDLLQVNTFNQMTCKQTDLFVKFHNNCV